MEEQESYLGDLVLITGNNEVLIVIDNAISSAAALQQLPPELIESLNVL
jgi:hypothetical protein